MDSLPLLSLFSGAGGLDLGFEEAGFSPMLALDIDPTAVLTYNHNRHCFREIAKVADLSITNPSAVIKWWEEMVGTNIRPAGIIGGPPCQAFSTSNVNKLANDPRAKLPLSYARILHLFNQRYDIEFFAFENVAGLAQHSYEPSLELFISEFKKAGFFVKQFFLDAVRFGVPQHRVRMFIVGFNSNRYRIDEFSPPIGDGTLWTVKQTIGKLVEPLFFSRTSNPAELGLHPNHWCMNPRSKKFGNGLIKI